MLTEESHARYIPGARVDANTHDAATRQIIDWAARGEWRCVIEAPIHMGMECYDHPDYLQCINRAELVTPGGLPIVWCLRLPGVRRLPRVCGPELMPRVCKAVVRTRTPVGFCGATAEVDRDLVRELANRYPGLPVVFIHAPPFRPLSADEDRQLCASIALSGCRILFVGLGCPKQEGWMAEHRRRVQAVMLGVGAAFDFISGHKPHAPCWLQRIGGERLFRLATEPRRLWRRYACPEPRFVVLAGWQLLRSRLGGPAPGAFADIGHN